MPVKQHGEDEEEQQPVEKGHVHCATGVWGCWGAQPASPELGWRVGMPGAGQAKPVVQQSSVWAFGAGPGKELPHTEACRAGRQAQQVRVERRGESTLETLGHMRSHC